MENGIIRVGLIGAGANTRLRHIPGLREQEGVEIVAVANRSRASGEAVASEYEIPTVYDNWMELVGHHPSRFAAAVGHCRDLHAVHLLETGDVPVTGVFSSAYETKPDSV